MKKLLMLTAFMLFCLCSYSQNLTVQNDSQYSITVGAAFEDEGECLGGSGNILFLDPGESDDIIGATGTEWTVVRAGILFIPVGPIPQVVSNAPCMDPCLSELELLLNATWSQDCYSVVIDD